MGHEKDLADMERAADQEAGVVVFDDLKKDATGNLRCRCGAFKGESHRRIQRMEATYGDPVPKTEWCPNDERNPGPRPSWDTFFMEIAKQTAARATCNRKHVGCVLVRDKRMIAGGYNGSISGLDHCDDVGHDMLEDHCVRTVHAEANAVADAANRGVALAGATAYVTALPCWLCFKLLAQAGIAAIVYGEAYRATDPEAKRTGRAAFELGINIHKHGNAILYVDGVRQQEGIGSDYTVSEEPMKWDPSSE